MNKKQILKYFSGFEATKTPITDKLIASGHPNKNDLYLQTARAWNVQNVTQYWHLIHCWAVQSKDSELFIRRIKYGELYVWMAEVSNVISKEELQELVDEVINDKQSTRGQKNRKLKARLFDLIAEEVESKTKNLVSKE